MSMFSKGWINYTYDAQGRLFTRDVGGVLNESYAYLSKPSDTTNSTTRLVSAKAVSDPNGASLKYFSYNYNSLGYIATEQETRSGSKLQYTYDNQGQLLTAKKSLNKVLQKTYTYTYDTYGNIRTATDGTTSHTYTYGDSNWLDLLTAYDGTALTYDTSGNPTSYYNGTSYTMTWRNGRELSTLTRGGKTTSYEYDVDGLRNLKTNADGSYSVYYWLGNLLLAEQRFASATATTPTWTMVFSYDENNTPIGYQLKGTSGVWYYYYYAKNVQGDIVALYRYDKDADGNKVATHIANYEYDPWGKVLSIKNASGTDLSNLASNSAVLNPFRYRGYYYDNEMGFYYVSSRYYDPAIGRWINADTTDVLSLPYYHLGQYNLFSYCNNNPVNDRDDDGQLSWLAKIAIGAAAIAIGVGVTALTGGAALPAIGAGVKAACVAGAISAGTSAATTAVCSAVSGDSFSTVVQKSAKAAVDGFADGFMAGGIAAGASQVASGGFKIAAKLGAKTGKSGGIKIGNTKILSPDAAWHKNNGGTLLKVGKTFRIDVGSNTLLHMHLPSVSSHVQIGTIGAGIYGGLK